MSFPLQINSVTLQEPYVRITRDPDKDDPPFATQSLQLWSKDGTNNGVMNPATIPLDGANLIINIASSSNDPFEFTLSASLNDKEIGISERMTYAAGTTSVNVTVPIKSSTCPWGSKGVIAWTVNFSSASQSWTRPVEKTPVQLYAIAGEIAPMYDKGGIPEDMLDLFVDEHTHNEVSIEAWVIWAVTRCHASKKDPIIQAAGVPTIHSYTYSNYAGEAMFTTGRAFDLARWLKSRDTVSVLSTVNCYDQAALVVCALSLGLPYHLRDQYGKIVTGNIGNESAEVTTLQRFGLGTWNNEVLHRFGFIKETDLVGWGQCNNPFFGSAKNAMLTSPDDKKRTSFGNHIFVCYNTLGNQGVAVQHALDACAGPIANPIPLQTYLEKVIDQPPSQALSGPDWVLGGAIDILPPTDTIQNLSLFKSGLETEVTNRESWKALCLAQGSRTAPTSPINASLTGLFASIPGVVTSKPDTYIVKDHSCISVEFSHFGDPQHTPFAAAVIDVMKDFASAKLQARSRIAHMDRLWEDVFAIPNEAQYLGDINMMAQPGIGIVVLVYGNISIWLDGSVASQTDFDSLVKSIDTYMSAAKKIVLTPKPDTAFTVSDVGKVTMEVPFQITITAPGVEEVEVDSELDIVHITKGPYPKANNPGVWVIDCITFRDSSDRLIFGFAEGDTFFPNTSKVISITNVS